MEGEIDSEGCASFRTPISAIFMNNDVCIENCIGHYKHKSKPVFEESSRNLFQDLFEMNDE